MKINIKNTPQILSLTERTKQDYRFYKLRVKARNTAFSKIKHSDNEEEKKDLLESARIFTKKANQHYNDWKESLAELNQAKENQRQKQLSEISDEEVLNSIVTTDLVYWNQTEEKWQSIEEYNK